jgi:hypothetical protein
MRLARVRAGIRRRAVWSALVEFRVLWFLRQKRQKATAIMIPGETIMKAFRK